MSEEIFDEMERKGLEILIKHFGDKPFKTDYWATELLPTYKRGIRGQIHPLMAGPLIQMYIAGFLSAEGLSAAQFRLKSEAATSDMGQLEFEIRKRTQGEPINKTSFGG